MDSPTAAEAGSAGSKLLSDVARRYACLFRKGRVELTYLLRPGSLANLTDRGCLRNMSERRKLDERDACLPPPADKVLVTDHARQRLGAQWLVPTLWRGDRLPPDAVWPMPFTVKSRHGCGQVVIVRDDSDYRKARRRSRGWMRRRYGAWLDEWLYSEIVPGRLVEP